MNEHASDGTTTTHGTPGPVLVLGATGKTGRLVTAGLRDRGVPVRAASRSGEVRFDWNDPSSWEPAVAGASAVYLVTPQDPAFSGDAVAALVRLAEQSTVRRLVLLSGLSAGYGSVPMLSREEPVRASRLEWTVLRPGAFQQNFSAEPYLTAFQAGELRLPLGPGPGPYSAYIHVEDIADVAVAVLTGTGHGGRTYELAGPRALSFSDVTDTIARATGLPFRFSDLPLGQWTAAMRDAGATEEHLSWSLETFEALRRGEYAPLHRGVQRVLGREPSDFRTYAEAAAAAGVWRREESGREESGTDG